MSPRPYDYESYALTKLSYPGKLSKRIANWNFSAHYIIYSNVFRTSPSKTPMPVCSLSMWLDSASFVSNGDSQ